MIQSINLGKIRTKYLGDFEWDKIYDKLDVIRYENASFVSVRNDNKLDSPPQSNNRWVQSWTDSKQTFSTTIIKTYNDF